MREIKGLTKRLDPDEPEFIIHVFSSKKKDYLYKSSKRNEIFTAIKFQYWITFKENLPILGRAGELKAYCSAKDDIEDDNKMFFDPNCEA